MHLQDNILPPDVQMQYLRPAQLEDRARQFPVVYVPFGLIEWHGRHLPLGNDAIKAHAILCKCAQAYGGVVYPPQWMSANFGPQLTEVYSTLFSKIKRMGFRVIIAISGHGIEQQIDMLERALEPVTADGSVRGYAGYEISLSKCAQSDFDHAAKWETSNVMHFFPDLVDMSALGDGPLRLDLEPPDGLLGLDPRVHASAEVGRRNCELAAQAIGEKARELLESLPPGQREFNIAGITPEHWWEI